MVLFVLWVVAVAGISLSFGLERAAFLDYNPINGDFQSYNVFRRILAGQVPYRDFANYVGMAPIVLNLPFLWLDGSFAASLFATNFTCNFLFSTAALLVLWLASGNIPLSLLLSAGLSKLLGSGLVRMVLGQGFGGYFTALFGNLYTPSNSMRMARLFWPFLLALGFLAFQRLRLWRGKATFVLVNLPRCPLAAATFGLLTGLGLTWSNDFGLAVLFTAAALMILLFIFGHKAAGPAALHWFFLAAAGGAVLSAILATGGNPGAWLDFTQGVGAAQYSYFNGNGGRALLPYIFTNPRLILYTIPYVTLLVFCLVQLVRSKATGQILPNRLVLAGFLAMSVLVATYAYIVSGSGYNFTEALEGCFWLAVLGLAGRGGLRLVSRWLTGLSWIMAGALLAFALLGTGLAARAALVPEAPSETAVLAPKLGGYVPYPKALVEAAEVTAGQDVFSLYATGLETVKGSFQPSGYDYVIHALGERAQNNYLADFLHGQYPFAQTTALGVEGWLAAENWYVYRHILAGYTQLLQTEYSWLWQRRAAPAPPAAPGASLGVTRENGVVVLTVNSTSTEAFVADVRLSYDVAFSSPGGFLLSLGRSAAALTVPDMMQPQNDVGFYLPAHAVEAYIPIRVENGEGRAILAPADGSVSLLTLHSASLIGTLPAPRAPMP